MKYFQFNKEYLDMYSPGQDLNHLSSPSWEWQSYAVPTTPQNLESSINEIDIYSNRLPHKYEQYWTAWGYIMQSRTILVLRLIPDKGRSKALPLFISMRGISNYFLVHLPSWHDELRVCVRKNKKKNTLNVSKCNTFGENLKFGICFTTSIKTWNLLYQREVTRKRVNCS